MSNRSQSNSRETGEPKSALLSNAAAVSGVVGAVEGTLGPKGLNCMLVGRQGDFIISNDGRAILERMEVTHPAAKLLVRAARAQDEAVGDGTTTACLLAGAMIAEGTSIILDGVPVAKVAEGLRLGLEEAVAGLHEEPRLVGDFDDPLLKQTALVAARGRGDIADLVLTGARIAGRDKCCERGFRLADWVWAQEGGVESEVFRGLILAKEPLNRQMPRRLAPARIALFDDALEAEALEEEALATEAGFSRYRELQEAFRRGLGKLLDKKINLVLCTRGVAEAAEQMLGEGGTLVLRRVSPKDLAKVAQHTGARPVKRSWLNRPDADPEEIAGRAETVFFDQKLKIMRLENGYGEAFATMLVGAGTAEVKEEYQRIAEDAACAVQQALLGGVVAGGGAAEMGLVARLEGLRAGTGGMAAYGVDCMIAALRRPLQQIAANAGFNPLEKVEQVKQALNAGQKNVGVDCDRGEICDMISRGVVDPANVKTQALKTATEVAEAILRVSTIIRARDGAGSPALPEEDNR